MKYVILISMARTRRYMHGRRRRCSPLKHSAEIAGYTHNEPHSEMSEQGDAVQKAMRDHESEESQTTSKKENRQAKRKQRKDYRQAKREWRKGGKEGDKPEKTWRSKS